MQEHDLRRSLSDELHARAFHDFDGAGRFIRYVFLTSGDTAPVLDYINEFPSPPHPINSSLPAPEVSTSSPAPPTRILSEESPVSV